MGQCKDCIYYERMRWVDDYPCYDYCGLFSKRVRTTASCNHFSERATPSNSGYTGGSGCFLTSACVDYLGKSDNCEELTVLRSFRDNYMKSTAKGSELVKQYYEIAPKIVEGIDNSVNKEQFYKYIYSVITNCVQFIKEENNEQAFAEYQKMVITLKDEFLS